MASEEMVMPKMGESIMEGTILKWLKKPGDKIEQDESVLEVATDKVDTEVPATHAGILKEILAKEGEIVPVGKPIAVIETGSSTKSTSGGSVPNPENTQETVKEKPLPIKTKEASVSDTAASNGKQTHSERFWSPLVRNIAKQENISLQELESIPGTGQHNRVTKKDILQYLTQRKAPNTGILQGTDFATSVKPAVSWSGEAEIIEMDRMRKMIAERMVESKRISPHVTSFVEADVTNVVIWRNKMKNEFKRTQGDNLTFTPIFIEAVIKALKDYPMMNISVSGDKIIVKKQINIGMAVALPSGNLIVPVIKNADQYNIVGLAKKVNDLANRARDNKLSPDDLSDGTYTVSNVGSFGNVMGTPIIMQPQVGILALGAVRKKPAVIETAQGDLIGIRHMMFLSHSYDHRVVDGSLGGMFVRRVADYLENFDANRKL